MDRFHREKKKPDTPMARACEFYKRMDPLCLLLAENSGGTVSDRGSEIQDEVGGIGEFGAQYYRYNRTQPAVDHKTVF
jgi:hypothetical protein